MAESGTVWKDRGHFRYNFGHLAYLPDLNLEHSRQEEGMLARISPQSAIYLYIFILFVTFPVISG